MSEKKCLFVIEVLRNIVNVYFDTFFVLYFFEIANYEVIPLAKYYLTLYLFCGIGFFLIKNAMKNNVKAPFFRLGLSMQAIYVALIMLLKDNIINYIFLVGIVKGLAEGFFYFPKNILDTEKVANEERQKYNGLLNTINKISSIIVPLILGILLTYIDYVNLGKIFFVLFIIMFIIAFGVKDEFVTSGKRIDFKKFKEVLNRNKNVKNTLWIPFLSGLTYSSGVMTIIATLYKINTFQTNFNLGIVDSICAFLYLLMCILFTTFIKKEWFHKIMFSTGIISFIILIIFAFIPSIPMLIIYLFLINSIVGLLHLISNNVTANLSNVKELKEEYKTEYYLIRDIIFSISRSIGYTILLVVCLLFGMDNIYYILIISGVSLLMEGVIVGKICKNGI